MTTNSLGEPEQRTWLARHWLFFVLVGTILAAFWVVLQEKGPRDYVCPKVNGIPGHSIVCGPEYDAVSLREAEQFLYTFYNAAHRTNPGTSWEWLAPEMQESGYDSREKAYADALDDILWGEITRVSTVPDRQNVFEVFVRRYSTDDRVAHHVFEVRLRKTADADVLMVRETSLGRAPGGRKDYHPMVYFRPVELHRSPRSTSTITLDPSDQGEGLVQLRSFCEIEVPSESPEAEPKDAGWWTRTNQGWIRNEDTTLNGEKQDILECGRFALED
jgi:hypothetical protein